MKTYSQEHLEFLKKEKRKKTLVYITQIAIILFLLIIWEVLSKLGIINTFLFSSPSSIIKTIKTLVISNNFFHHVLTTLYEILISTLISFILGFLIASILYTNEFLRKVFDPYLTYI